jgi:DNA-binding NtrC family response regulator
MDEEKVTVLIVDDEKMICDVLENDLSEQGYECNSAQTGEDALTELRLKKYDVVLLDIRLPGISGLEVLMDIWLHHKGTATIMITGVNDVDTAVAAMKSGADDYIAKPFDLDKVDTSIRKALVAKQASVSQEQIASIARGVEARMDPSSSVREMITERTVYIAQLLGIAEEEIHRWAASNVEADAKKSKIIEQSKNITK